MPESTRITILSDNNAQSGLNAEHGFAALIVQGNKRFIFDTGQHHTVLFENAQKLNIRLDKLDGIILSHGHYDHCGNISSLIDVNPHCAIYLHPDALKVRYSLHPNKEPKKISMADSTIERLKNLPLSQLYFNKGAIALTESIWLSGEIPRINQLEDISGPFYLNETGIEPDKLLDDQCLWITHDKGLSVLTGCCHAGIINTLSYISQTTNQDKFAHVIGGLHLASSSPQKVGFSINALKKRDIKKLYLGHCTGENVILQLQQELMCQVKSCYAGLTLKVC